MMTTEERFRHVCAALVITQQDAACLAEENAALLARCCRVEEARAIILGLLKASELGPGLDPHLDERAQEWLKGV